MGKRPSFEDVVSDAMRFLSAEVGFNGPEVEPAWDRIPSIAHVGYHRGDVTIEAVHVVGFMGENGPLQAHGRRLASDLSHPPPSSAPRSFRALAIRVGPTYPSGMVTSTTDSLPALGICLEEYTYPFPVEFFPVTSDLKSLKMAYMDVPPKAVPNGKTAVLMHGKAFGGYYFLNVIEALTGAGYRVIAPDQFGWGKSPKPDFHYSFHMFAHNTAGLLDHLGVGTVAVLGHSTGGMTAVRFTLMNPDRVTHLVLEDPLGLADYRIGIPAQTDETLYNHEINWTDPKVIRAYVNGYFVHPDPKVCDPLADILIRVTLSPGYQEWARSAALTFQMIYQQPVRHEYHLIKPPTLLIVGAEDHVVPLGQYASPEELGRLGDFVTLSEEAARDIPDARRVVVPECGHIPHLEKPAEFLAAFLPFFAD